MEGKVDMSPGWAQWLYEELGCIVSITSKLDGTCIKLLRLDTPASLPCPGINPRRSRPW